jgi:hypothetical protein
MFIGYCLLFLIAFAFVPAFTNIRNNMRANYAKWPVSGQRATKMDNMSVDCFPAKEVGRDSCYIHQPSNQEASANAEDKRDKQEDEAGRVELQIGYKLLAKDGEDGGEDVERQAVATEKEDPPAPFRGSNSIEPKQGGNGEINNYN